MEIQDGKAKVTAYEWNDEHVKWLHYFPVKIGGKNGLKRVKPGSSSIKCSPIYLLFDFQKAM